MQRQAGSGLRVTGAFSVVLSTGFDMMIAIFLRVHPEVDRTAAHLAILDILLLFHRPVHQQRDGFPAVGAADNGFLQKIH
jgi:hypothetical protein